MVFDGCRWGQSGACLGLGVIRHVEGIVWSCLDEKNERDQKEMGGDFMGEGGLIGQRTMHCYSFDEEYCLVDTSRERQNRTDEKEI